MSAVAVLQLVMVVVALVLLLRATVLRRRNEAIAALALIVAWLAATQDVPGDLPDHIDALIASGVMAACLAIALGALSNRPAWLAQRLGLVQVAVEVEIDAAISRLVPAFNELLSEGEATRPAGEALDTLRRRAEAIAHQLRALQAPSPEWDLLIRDYVALVELRLQHFGSALPGDALREFEDVNGRATVRLVALRREYMQKHRSNGSCTPTTRQGT